MKFQVPHPFAYLSLNGLCLGLVSLLTSFLECQQKSPVFSWNSILAAARMGSCLDSSLCMPPRWLFIHSMSTVATWTSHICAAGLCAHLCMAVVSSVAVVTLPPCNYDQGELVLGKIGPESRGPGISGIFKVVSLTNSMTVQQIGCSALPITRLPGYVGSGSIPC